MDSDRVTRDEDVRDTADARDTDTAPLVTQSAIPDASPQRAVRRPHPPRGTPRFAGRPPELSVSGQLVVNQLPVTPTPTSFEATAGEPLVLRAVVGWVVRARTITARVMAVDAVVHGGGITRGADTLTVGKVRKVRTPHASAVPFIGPDVLADVPREGVDRPRRPTEVDPETTGSRHIPLRTAVVAVSDAAADLADAGLAVIEDAIA